MPVCEVETEVFRSAAEVLSLVRGFEFCTLTRAEWTHRAHLTVALWYCLRHPFAEAKSLVRDGIRKYNAAHGIAQTPTGGYHETMTLFWLRIVRKYLTEVSGERCSLATLANGLVERYADKSLPFEYYTRALIFSSEARAVWVEPDLKTLE
ncbi:MAG: hypothetical protein JO360_11380 [Acidobacteria bacterium]|nr:hypothetical protein [Acidobacteriota bacterium]